MRQQYQQMEKQKGVNLYAVGLRVFLEEAKAAVAELNYLKEQMMKIYYLILTTLFMISCGGSPYDAFGEKISSEVSHNYISVLSGIQSSTESGEGISLSGEILETCSKKGCWMKLKMEGGDTLLVRFKDYSYFVPKTGQEKKEAIIKGNAFMDTLTVDVLRHYAEDAGKSKNEINQIDKPIYSLNFIADGVLIKK